MKYIYLGQSDLYLPVTAAALHLRLTEKHELFRAATKEDQGQLYHVGRDGQGNDVYVATIPNHADVFLRGVESLLAVYSLSLREALVVPCVPENPQLGLICRLLDAIGLGRVANRLGTRLADNRRSDLHHLIPTTP
jgi:hypothetical protein